MVDYSIDASAHLKRAMSFLLKGGTASLLYASLELRMGTEARQAQYANSWGHIPNRIKRDYATTAVGKGLDRAFRIGDQIVELTYLFTDGSPPISLFYTPVSRELRRVCDLFGNYLHWPKWQAADGNGWEQWTTELLELVITGAVHLHLALSGQLLGPAMMETQGGKRVVTLKATLPSEDEGVKRLGDKNLIGVPNTLRVRHHAIDTFAAPLLDIAKKKHSGSREAFLTRLH
ncbi:hypothetical protein HDE78_001499 [Rhodanobacter sp. K2T2]|uniref:hypothetical protein n=1 Tax=Rhodanobacter sp. K2T2 TaxID=2723085 RepID=UPI0015CB39F3|nr:hypothetical protein [Rhodanobacter sp. K2T2]NYE28547.1 hypothetical protein [Rhodanobacter sp. K2T2]